MTWLVFKVNQLGDNVVFLPVVQSLVRSRPQDRIIVVTSPLAAPLYHIACPGVTVLTFPTAEFNGAWKRPWKLLPMLRQIRPLKPDVALLGDDQGNVAHLLARLSGARISVGPKVPGRWLGPLLQARMPLEETRPASIQNWNIYRLAVHKTGLEMQLGDVPPPPDLSAFGQEPHGAIAIHPGASLPYKRWPLERYVALANRLSETSPVVWFQQGHAEESSLHPHVQQVKPNSLESFIRQMAGARFFIGNNSGPMNIAAALGIPGVILNGPARPNWDPMWHGERFDILRDPHLACQPCDLFTRPVNECQNREHPMTCMDRWTVEKVYHRVQERLALSPR